MTTSRKRFYPGAEVGEQLCNWLNGSKANGRVVNLLSRLADAMQFGGAFVTRARQPKWKPKAGDSLRVIRLDPESPVGYHVIEKRLTEADAGKYGAKYGPRQRKTLWAGIARTLRRYSFVPELDEWVKVWDKQGQGRKASFRWHSRNGQEGMAVLWILELLNIGRLSRVRRCQCCSKWFFSAVKEDGKFCSVKCQRNFSKAKDETRKQHTEYMRAWRSRKEQGRQ